MMRKSLLVASAGRRVAAGPGRRLRREGVASVGNAHTAKRLKNKETLHTYTEAAEGAMRAWSRS